MADKVKQILAKPIQVADQVIKVSDEASSFRQECLDLKAKTTKLADLLRQAARSSSDLYERPTARILSDTEQVLDKALALALKYRSANGFVRRAFTLVPAAYSRKLLSLLDNSIGDVSWLLRVSAPADSSDDHDYLGLPPIAANEPILCLIWEQVALLQTGSLDDRADAAASLVSLARDNDRYGSLILEEGGIAPLLKLLKEGRPEGQENAARALGLLGRDPESVELMIHAGACAVFAKLLKEAASMRVQAMVAWAVSELASHSPKSQDLFAQHNVVRLLVTHLAFETIQEHSKYTVASHHRPPSSIHQLVIATSTANSNSKKLNINKSVLEDDDEDDDEGSLQFQRPKDHIDNGSPMHHNKLQNVVATTIAMKAQSQGPPKPAASSSSLPKLHNNHHSPSSGHHSLSGARARELEDPATKANLKAMAARALWRLAANNSAICRSITESRALLCFAVLLDKGANDEIKFHSAMSLMEITSVAEEDHELRRSAFKPTSPACKAVVDQILRVVVEEAEYSNLLLPCIKAIGNLARTFRATETRMIAPLVAHLDEQEPEVSREAAIALTKFAGSENYLHVDHSKAIIEGGGIKHLVQLVYFGEQMVKIPALVLLAYIAKHAPESEELAENQVLNVLEWALKQPNLMQDEDREYLLMEAKSRVEIYQSRASR